MSIFITGGTGFLGSYALTELLQRTDDQLMLLTRATDAESAAKKLWKTLQMHMSEEEATEALSRLTVLPGDLHAPKLGLSEANYAAVTEQAESVLHIAASLNRKSAKACLNSNLRGTLSVIKLTQDVQNLRRYTHVSTVAVAGERSEEVVEEDSSIDWDRSDYDPYGRTKKFCEHMATELLPDVSKVFLRPSIVLGDSRFPETTQFDMVRAFCGLADLPIVPLRATDRFDIIPANYVGEAIARLHLEANPKHERYHLSAGRNSPTAREVGEAMAQATGKPLRFAPKLNQPFSWAVRAMNRLPRSNPLQPAGALMKVFWPYLEWDTVFANERVVDALGHAPARFPEYCGPLYTFATGSNFRYPYTPTPAHFAEKVNLGAGHG